jgi:hypothetical protein
MEFEVSYQAVLCSTCKKPILLDGARIISVGGGAMPYADMNDPAREREMMCIDCRTVTPFSDRDIVPAE